MSQSEALASRRAWVDGFPAPMEVITTCRHILPKVVMTLQSNPEKSLLIFIVWNELVSNAYIWQIIRLFTCLTHVMGIQDSLGLWIVRRKFRIPGTGHRILYPTELGFWIPIVSGILYSLSCIPDSKAKDFIFHKQKFPSIRNPYSLTWGCQLPHSL